MKVGLIVPHIFMHREILPQVIFSPAALALFLAEGLPKHGAEVTLYTPGPIDTPAVNVNADLSGFEAELAARGDTYLDLLKKHPLTFVTLARQTQAELISKAYQDANQGKLDVVHVYANEEELALPMAKFCQKPVVFTHHDPFNFLVKYRSVMPKYKDLPWIATSDAQRQGMPPDTNWLATIYHGLPIDAFTANYNPTGDYIAYIGRIIEPKGVHLAIAAVKQHNQLGGKQYKLRIAGKHYSGTKKDSYWLTKVESQIDNQEIFYDGYISDPAAKQEFLGNAAALIVPSTFEEPFGMVNIEALACATPVIGLDSGAIPEIINDGANGFVATKDESEAATIQNLVAAMSKIDQIDRQACRQSFEDRFTLDRMCAEHLHAYKKLLKE